MTAAVPDALPPVDDAVERVRAAPPPLAAFNAAGVLAPADVHAAVTVARLAGESDPEVLLAAALAVRAPRLQHVCVALDRVRDTATGDAGDPVGADTLPWPVSTARWRARLEASPLVAVGADAPDERPLRLVDDRLYLDRYWRYERQVLAHLRARAGAAAGPLDAERLDAGLDRLFGEPAGGADLQRAAAAAAVRARLAVIAGGPGTGKTHTVGRILVLLAEQAQAAGTGLPRVALAAPTGKAAQRMEAALAGALGALAVGPELRAWLLDLEAVTLHRLLRRQPGSRTRFRHHAGNPLPHEVIVVDEASMASLALVARLLDAVRTEARLVLVGDPEQLASVEAGSVLGDLVGPVASGAAPPEPAAGAVPDLRDRIVMLRRGFRFEAGIAELADAIRVGDADATCALLADGRPDVRWIAVSVDDWDEPEAPLAPLRSRVAEVGSAVHVAARQGDAEAALSALDRLRILCAHRRGPAGVATWAARVERWLAEDVPGFDPSGRWHVGRPVLVTRNDYQLGVLNGDLGVTVAGADGLAVAFRRGEGVRLLEPSRLEHVETVHAMTVHKAQGSEFDAVAVLLPGPDSPILSRELLYTAVTRAREAVTVVGDAEAVRTAVNRRIQRASGLAAALWGADG